MKRKMKGKFFGGWIFSAKNDRNGIFEGKKFKFGGGRRRRGGYWGIKGGIQGLKGGVLGNQGGGIGRAQRTKK